MTTQSRDGTGTEFSHWLRVQPEIDSCLGFIATNLDFIWSNNKTGNFILIEENRYKHWPSSTQRKLLIALHESISSEKYKGLYLLIFEKTNPDDGGINLHKYIGNKKFIKKIITRNQLINFLRNL
jgi:hypothetical protein